MTKLIFSESNKKLDKLSEVTGKRVYNFSLLAGHSCPYAKICLAKATLIDGKMKVVDGPDAEIRCFSASQETMYPNVYKARKHNFDLIKSCNSVKEMIQLISDSIPHNANIIRVHVSGDFFNYTYLNAWLEVAYKHSNIHFYAYTKSVPLYLKAKEKGLIPSNFMFTMSRGGTHDDLIDKHKLKQAIMVYSEVEANQLGLPIDKTDYLAAFSKGSFALQIHSMGKTGSRQAKLFASKIKRKKKEKK